MSEATAEVPAADPKNWKIESINPETGEVTELPGAVVTQVTNAPAAPAPAPPAGTFRLTLHELGTAEQQMNELRKTNLLYEARIIDDGCRVVCLWVRIQDGVTYPVSPRLI